MENHDSGSITGFTVTVILGVFAHWTKSDIAIYVTILAGITTITVNILKMINSKDK